MIYITGDCHTDYRRFTIENFPEQKEMSKDDYVIICGDFGFWDDSKKQQYWRKWLEDKPFTTLWIDGNHENYDLLKQYEVQEWHGGKVQFIMPSVIHLMRGQIYHINGLEFFTFGGARSHDIQGGILDPHDVDFKAQKKKLDKGYLPYRINHQTWWSEEFPTKEEMDEGRENLERVNWKVDYIVTHDGARSDIEKNFEICEMDELNDFLEEIKNQTTYRAWFFGHHHDNMQVDEKDYMIYEQIIDIPTN